MSPRFYIYNPVLEHSELLRPGEDRPEARSISLSVTATELIANLKAGRKGHPSKPKKVRVIASPGAPLIKLKQSLEFGALEGGESTPDSLKDILVETSNHQSE